MQRISIKTTVRSVAEKMLARYQTEVDRIRTGVATREELAKAQFRHTTLEKALEQYRTKMVAAGITPQHITHSIKSISRICKETGINSLSDIRREAVERWMAQEVEKKVLATRTINAYLMAIKSFTHYLVDIELLPSLPLKFVRKLNQEIDPRKKRRAMTADEVERLLKVAALGKRKSKKWKPGERVLIYRLLLGTGLRSTELSLLTPNQINFERCRLTIEAAKTKNKKADVLPMRPDLVQSVKAWITEHGIQSHERIFHYEARLLCDAFYSDLKTAGIERKNLDGRCLDIHALRKTFGTMLAKAGVPLTTTQRLMRHYSPEITAKLYIDVDPLDMSNALGQLPTFGYSESPIIPTSPK